MRIGMRLVAALAACGGLSSSAASAAVITFGTPTTINGGGTNSVLDVGFGSPIVDARWVGLGSTNVAAPLSGTITFNNISTATAAPSGTASGVFQAGVERGNAAIFTNPGGLVASDLANVLTQHAFESTTAAATPIVLRLGGLTAGQQYAVQLFAIDDRNATKLEQFSDGTTNSATFNSNANNYVLATFTADAVTQDIRVGNVSAVSGKDLNAYVLRAVPEPGAVAVVGLGALTLAGRRRRSA
jgi:hypothetical protein